MEIKILGTSCTKCKKLEKSAREAVKEMGLDMSVTKVEDITEIMRYGIMSPPALLIDDKVVVRGKALSTKEMKNILESLIE